MTTLPPHNQLMIQVYLVGSYFHSFLNLITFIPSFVVGKTQKSHFKVFQLLSL